MNEVSLKQNPRPGYSRRMLVLISVLLVLAIPCLIALRIGFESPRSPHLSITFLGYTNDPAGAPLARFEVSNFEASAVEWSAPIVEVKTPAESTGHFVRGNAILEGKASRILTVPVPTNQAPWRVHLRVYPDVGTTREVKRFVTHTLLRIGLNPRYQSMPYAVDSDWVEAGK